MDCGAQAKAVRLAFAALISLFPCIILSVIFSSTYGSVPHETTFVSLLNRNCYEANGKVYAEQFIMIYGNITAVHNCGPVISCLGSPCYLPFTATIGETIYVTRGSYSYLFPISKDEYTSAYILLGFVILSALLLAVSALASVAMCMIASRSGQQYAKKYETVIQDDSEVDQ